MKATGSIRLLAMFTLAFSLLVVQAPLLSRPVDALTQPPQNPWYPSGPAMNTLQYSVCTDSACEFSALETGQIDLTDTPLSASLFCSSCLPPNVLVTPPVAVHSYFSIEFLLANVFWNCNMGFGDSACGINIRQAVSHLIDKQQFVVTDPNLMGLGVALDNPVPPNNGGLPSANPCAWDSMFPESGSQCVVGASGGVSYHLATATGVNYAWQYALGSPDFCAAAQHMIAAGLASGDNPSTCVLTGLNSAVTSSPVNIFVRNDDSARLDLGLGLSQEICALFTGSFTTGCPELTVTQGNPSTFFSLQDVCIITSVCLNWQMYTAGFSSVYPFDASLYYTYNSRFVNGIPSVQPPNGPCSSAAVPSYSPANYMYMCNPNFDNLSGQMEYAPCLSAAGDPTPGQATPTFANCPNTLQLTAVSAGYKSEDAFGQGAFDIPVYTRTSQYAFLDNWQRVINDQGTGLPNYFTWLDTYSASPAVTGTIRQGLAGPPITLNPYVASTTRDLSILRNIYDSLDVSNPSSNDQRVSWMTLTGFQTLHPSQLTYVPPPGTTTSIRVTLRNDMFWQDGRRVSPFDLVFSYISFLATGAFQSVGAITGITVLSPFQADIHVSSLGPFTEPGISSLTILPGHYWSSAGAPAWDSETMSCSISMAPGCFPAQYYFQSGSIACTYQCSVPASSMNPAPAKIVPSFDPLAAGILIGSGSWMCTSTSGVVGTGCSSSGNQNPTPGGTLTLTRFGILTSPGGSLSQTYFRSSGNLALWAWSKNTGDFSRDFLNFGSVAACFGKSPVPLSCNPWTMGIGNPTGSSSSPAMVGLVQIGIVQRFVGVDWVSPYNWVTSPPSGIASFPPLLYEGSFVLSPASMVGCTSSYNNGGGYDC